METSDVEESLSRVFSGAKASQRGVFDGNLRPKDVQQRRAAMALLAVGGLTRVLYQTGKSLPGEGNRSEVVEHEYPYRRSVRTGSSVRTSVTGGNLSSVGQALQMTTKQSFGYDIFDRDLGTLKPRLMPEIRPMNSTSATTGQAATEVAMGSTISEEEAKEIALKAVPGEVMEVAVERKLGAKRFVVEVIATPDGAETDVIIEMETGKVLAIEK